MPDGALLWTRAAVSLPRFNVAGISRCRMAGGGRGEAPRPSASMWPASLDAGWRRTDEDMADVVVASMWPASLDAGWVSCGCVHDAQAKQLQCGRHLSMPDGWSRAPYSTSRVSSMLQCGRHLSMPDGVVDTTQDFRGDLASMWPAPLDAGWRDRRSSARRQARASMWPAPLDAGWGDEVPRNLVAHRHASMWPAPLDAGWVHCPVQPSGGFS